MWEVSVCIVELLSMIWCFFMLSVGYCIMNLIGFFGGRG